MSKESDVRRRMRIFFSSTIVCGAIAAVITFFSTPMYMATAIVLPPPHGYPNPVGLPEQTGEERFTRHSLGLKNPADPYVGILSSPGVADDLISRFALRDVYKTDSTADARKELVRRTGFNAVRFSMIEVSVRDSDPKRAAELANGYIDLLLERSSRIAIAEGTKTAPPIQIVDRAVPPDKKFSPRPGVYIPAGVIFGAMLGLLASLARGAGSPEPCSRSKENPGKEKGIARE